MTVAKIKLSNRIRERLRQVEAQQVWRRKYASGETRYHNADPTISPGTYTMWNRLEFELKMIAWVSAGDPTIQDAVLTDAGKEVVARYAPKAKK